MFVPEGYAPFADAGEMVELAVTVEDGDGDPVTVTWFVDGVEAGTGESFAYEMPDEEYHYVRVVAADDDPYSADAEFTFHVRSSIWEDQVGETGGDSSGGVDDTAGGADGTATDDGGGTVGGGSDDTATGGSGSAGADGGSGGGGCGCTSSGSSTPAWAGLLMLVLGIGARRRRR
jgi:MYXO-CTERM domain-containing protein